MRIGLRVVLLLACVALAPSVLHAQGTIAGTVKDASGAVLPGVTIEAASPALIEKSRSVVTDGTGQYKIIDLRPGTYSVTFTLPGFNTVKRDDVELTGAFTATVNADLKVGAVEESITVTGETPIVDVQSTTKERVLQHDVIEALPTGRLVANLGVLVPGVMVTSNQGQMTGTFQDVGGSAGDGMSNLVAHGSRADNARITVNGGNINAISGYMGGRSPNPAAMQEMAVDSGGASAEAAQGGPRINMVPREGGNSFKGSLFGSFANHSMEGSNNTPDLIARGLPVPNSVYKIWDFNPGFGGPIKRDKLWFYGTVRNFGADNYVGAGVFPNLNANQPALWTYAPDLNAPAISRQLWEDAQTRVTWQATPRNKLAFSMDVQRRWGIRWINGDISSPEAQSYSRFPQQRAFSADWTAPLTSRMLLEVGGFQAVEGFHNDIHEDATAFTQMINVVEQSTGRSYRGPATYSNSLNQVFYPRASLSYVTGAHAFKVGYNDEIGFTRSYTYQLQPPLAYRFNNGVPNQLTQYATPFGATTDLNHDLGLFAQDKWTVRRLTLNLGVRYDWRLNSFPEQQIGPAALALSRNLTFPYTPNESLKDITPKVGMAYDVFGTGKTAVRVSLNKYLQGSVGNVIANPVSSLVNSTSRSWADANKNFVPDCVLTNPLANGECGAMANSNFGKVNAGSSVSVDPKLISGWGNRNYNWEFSTGIQQQIFPRVSVDVAYFRRWYGNFPVTDNLTVAASDYTAFSISAPTNALLPGGGGNTISGLYDVNPAKFGLPVNNFNTLDATYGNQIEHYNGVDFSLNARLNGLLIQGGFSTGRREMNNCDIVAKVPEMLFGMGTLTYGTIANSWLPAQFCDQKTAFETQAKLLAVYTVPKVAVQVSGTFQSLPGPLLYSNFNAPNALVATTLGRSISGGAANLTVDVVAPGTAYGDRLNQLDLRFGKILKFGRTRSALNFDVYNVLNRNPVLVESQAYATYRQPQQIMLARFAKVGINFDF